MLSWFVSLQIPIGAGFSVLPTILLLADACLFLHLNFSPVAIPLPPPFNTQSNPITTTSGNKLLLKAQVQYRKTAALKKNLSLGIKQLCSGSFSVLHRRFLLAVFIFFLSSQQFSMLLYPTRFFYHPLFSHWAKSPHYQKNSHSTKKNSHSLNFTTQSNLAVYTPSSPPDHSKRYNFYLFIFLPTLLIRDFPK